MKATLNYNLDDPDDILHHKRAVKSLDFALALWEISLNLRGRIEGDLDRKDPEEKVSPEDAIEMVFNRIDDILMEYDININHYVV